MNIQSLLYPAFNPRYQTAEEIFLAKTGYELLNKTTSDDPLNVNKEQQQGLISAIINNKIESLDNSSTSDATQNVTSDSSIKDIKIESLENYDVIMQDILIPDAQGNVHEEQMQFALTYFILAKKDEGLAQQYLNSFNDLISSGNPPMQSEDAIKAALKNLVSDKRISSTEAETINGITFRAAQLDDNLKALYDNRGSANDTTIAVMGKEAAIKQSFETLAKIELGELSAPVRSLETASNVVPGSITVTSFKTVSGSDSIDKEASKGVNSSQDPKGFVWKPRSDADGKLAILLPASISRSVHSAEIHSDLPISNETLIDKGKKTSLHNQRQIFRFSKDGSSYPNNCYVVAKLNDGSIETFKITDTSSRVN